MKKEEPTKGKPQLTVVELNQSDYLNPAKMLRNIADDIEANKFGQVTSIAVLSFGDTGLEIFGGGEDSSAPTIALLINAANCRFATGLLDSAMGT